VVPLTRQRFTNSTAKHVTYSLASLPATPYADARGRRFTTVVTPSARALLASCSNGNLYALPNAPLAGPACSAMWTVAADGALVGDGAGRAAHYYNDTMAALGVSRLRVADGSRVPATGAAVVLAPYAEDGEAVYVAVDASGDVFYLMLCSFENGDTAKVFLAEDPVEGAATLQSEAVRHTVTGGKVRECYPLSLRQGVSSEDGYARYMQQDA
jgi:hypothetical protein